MKPTDKAIHGMVSESPGRNESEPRSGLERKESEAEPPSVGRRQHGMTQANWNGMSLRRGGRDGTGDKSMISNWRKRPRPIEKSVEQCEAAWQPTGDSTLIATGDGICCHHMPYS